MKTIFLLLTGLVLAAEERAVNPTFLRTNLANAAAAATPLTTPSCRVYPVFGEGAPRAAVARGVARFARIAVDANGKCAPLTLGREEQSWFIMKGEGALNGKPLRRDDFVYVPAGTAIELSAAAAGIELVQQGYRVPEGRAGGKEIQIANAADVKKQVVGNHPPSTLYQLLIGDTRSTRDRIAAGAVLTSLFIMDIKPDGTNFPHNHDREEEIYLLLEGEGLMVAGGGSDGVEGKFPAKAGDAYFFRLNTTVGFYNTSRTNARILAARSLYPFGKGAN